MYKTIICKENNEKYFGKIIGDINKHRKTCGTIVDYWQFEHVVDGEIVVWSCLSDYWELVHADLRKVERALRSNQSQEKGLMNKVKKILKWGYCKC